MKSIFRLFFIMILTMSFGVVYAEEVTIDKVIEAFNTGMIYESYAEGNGSVVATYDQDSVDVSIKFQDVDTTVTYDLNGTVLTANIDSNDENSFLKAYIFVGLIDEIGILHGYEAGELSQTVNSDLVLEYTLEDEGFENVLVSDTVREIKIDYTKKVPLVDFSDVYIEVEDLEKYKEYITGDGQAGTTKGDIYIAKFGYDGEYEVIVGEKDELTDATYNSILSMIKVMFDKKTVAYFKENYPSLGDDKSFGGFDIKVNYSDPDISDIVYLEDNGYKVVYITVDKETVLSAVDSYVVSNEIEDDAEEPVADEEKEENKTSDEEEAAIVKKDNVVETILKDYGIYIGIGAGVLVLFILIIFIVTRKKKTVTAVENYETVNISMSDMGRVIRPAVFNKTEPVQGNVQQNQHSVQQQVQQVVPQQEQQMMMQQQMMNNGMTQGQMPINNMVVPQQQMPMQQPNYQQQAMMQQQMNQGQSMNNMQNMNNYPNNYNGNNNYNGQ